MKVNTSFKGKFKSIEFCTKKCCTMIQFYPWFKIDKIYNTEK